MADDFIKVWLGRGGELTFEKRDDFRIHGAVVRFCGRPDPIPHPIGKPENEFFLLLTGIRKIGHKAICHYLSV